VVLDALSVGRPQGVLDEGVLKDGLDQPGVDLGAGHEVVLPVHDDVG